MKKKELVQINKGLVDEINEHLMQQEALEKALSKSIGEVIEFKKILKSTEDSHNSTCTTLRKLKLTHSKALSDNKSLRLKVEGMAEKIAALQDQVELVKEMHEVLASAANGG